MLVAETTCVFLKKFKNIFLFLGNKNISARNVAYAHKRKNNVSSVMLPRLRRPLNLRTVRNQFDMIIEGVEPGSTCGACATS